MNKDNLLNDSEAAMNAMLEGFQSRLWTCLPAIVIDVDLSKQTISAQPAITAKVYNALGIAVDTRLPLLVDVPICYPRAGGFAITFPIRSGDEVLIVFASRCIDSWWQSGGVGNQAELRMHDLSDGFALLAPTSQPKKLSAVQNDGVELRNDSRDTYIKLTNGVIFIKGNIIHEGNYQQAGNMVRTGTRDQTGNDTVVGTSTANVFNQVIGGFSNLGAVLTSLIGKYNGHKHPETGTITGTTNSPQ